MSERAFIIIGDLVWSFFKILIQTVFCNVEFTILEPSEEMLVLYIEDRFRKLVPFDLFSRFSPKLYIVV
jgi:hypothetical protein